MSTSKPRKKSPGAAAPAAAPANGPAVHPDTPKGNVDKNVGTGYRELLERNTTYAHHPRHHEVKMQAHHLISQKGLELGKLGPRLADFGYEINALNNLVFIPYTLQGGCLLGIQPHRGNHTAVNPPDKDSNRDPSYHERVRDKVKEVMRALDDVCGLPTIQQATQEAMDKISALFAFAIQSKPSEAKLTALWMNFNPGNPVGCGGVDYVNDKRISHTCPVARKHTGKQGPLQMIEGLTYVPTAPYVLRPGH